MAEWRRFNNNPAGNKVGDCVVRAISKILNQDWEKTYIDLCLQGYMMHDMPSANEVWLAYLKSRGFVRSFIPDAYPDSYTVIDFCEDFPKGDYLVATGSHIVAVQDGVYFDTWDSGFEAPIYFLKEGEKKNGI